MEAKELFSAAVKVIGLLSIGRGIYDFVYVLIFALKLDNVSVTAKYPTGDLLLGLFYFFCGFYLLRGGDFIVNFAFPSRKVETKESKLETIQEQKISE